MISRPSTHRLFSRDILEKEKADLTIRAISVRQPHRAVPITVTTAIAAAGNLKGSVLHEFLSEDCVDTKGIPLGHASWKIVAGAHFDGNRSLKEAVAFRTA